ncbi:hypothetical protein [Streptomyces sp. PT12]|uniref:hypothetical protein n=1 Tax=Streptomyces sp. PT12 TaxID=1510197 RepID=UPI00215BCBEE|nr:hypothetical protein [Streptomyces sp. PT12]
MLETHLGCNDFFQGSVLDLIREGEVLTTVEDLKVSMRCSTEASRLVAARNGWPPRSSVDTAEKELRAVYERRGKDARELYKSL